MSATVTQTIRLLVVDDETELLQAVCDTLREQGLAVAGFADPNAALKAISPDKFDLVLSDLMMPGLDGIQLLKEALQIDPHLIGIIMTGAGSIHTAVEAMRVGAFDFIQKPFRLQRIIPILDRAMIVRQMRADNERLKQEVALLEAERVRLLEEANARLLTLATTDPLTGLTNRRTFDEVLAREAALADRGIGPLSLLLLDVDHFKGFNDTFGHPAGDDVLRQIALAIRTCCRSTDLPARLGGEEFAVLLPGTDIGGALVLAERIRHAIEAGPWPLRPVTASIGVAMLDGSGSRGLIETADRVLYEAKRNGRNKIASANPNG